MTAGEAWPLIGAGSWEPQSSRGKERTSDQFAGRSPVFFWQFRNEARGSCACAVALTPQRKYWLFFRGKQLGLHNGLQLSRII